MKKEVTGSREFLDEILTHAHVEADELVTQAEKRAESRKNSALAQEEALMREAEKQLEEERKRLEKLSDQKISSEIRRKELQLRDRFMTEALDRTREKLLGMTATEEYSAVLADWVLEGVLGLDAKTVELNGRVREREIMTDEWLREQEKRLKNEFGREVEISLSFDAPLIGAGVVAKQKGGRLVYNNQIDTRLLRKQSELRKAIYEELFEGE